MNQPHALDDLLEEMLPNAGQMVVYVRDRDTTAATELLAPLNVMQLRALIVDLAVMVDDQVPFGELLAWTHGPAVTPEQYAEILNFNPRPGMKWCPGCEDWLPFEEFNKDRTKPDGRKPRCRMCMSTGRLAKKAAA